MSAPEALQTALAAEHAAVYVYGALGAQTSQSAEPALFAAVTEAYVAHRDRRDDLVARVVAAGGTPVAAAPAYDLPAGLENPGGVGAAALDLRRACARTYAFCVAGTQDDNRRLVIAALTDAALRELAFGGAPQTLPGSDATG